MRFINLGGRTSARLFLRVATFVCVAALVLLLGRNVSLAVGRVLASVHPAPGEAAHAGAGLGRDAAPVHIEPVIMPSGCIQPNNAREIERNLRREDVATLSDALHVLRLFGKGATVRSRDHSTRIPILAVALGYDESRSHFGGHPTLIDTREGVRCRVIERNHDEDQHERQAHEDQLLAILGEVGVPLDYPVSTAGGRRAVRDLLNDSLAKFDFSEREIEWSALAFAFYVPPRTSWEDRYGRVHTFDQLADELMGRELNEDRSCAGIHLIHSLLIILRVDEQRPILTAPARARVRGYLASMAARVSREQSVDGSWRPDWYRPHDHAHLAAGAARSNGDAWLDVLATGHLAEWLMHLPADLQPPRDTFPRAVRWIESHLLSATSDDMLKMYCPYSHAGGVVIREGQRAGAEPATAGGGTPRVSSKAEGRADPSS